MVMIEDAPPHKFSHGDTVVNENGTEWNVWAVYWDVERKKLVYDLHWQGDDHRLTAEVEPFEEEFEKV